MNSATQIRQERTSDYPDVYRLNKAAFGQENEGNLVNALRGSESFIPELSLVAITENSIVGHILFTRVIIRGDSGERFESLSLAPMAVEPSRQKQGVGSRLVSEGLKRASALDYKSIIVLGHPEYYPRFGFRPASLWGIKAPFDVPDNAFLALELTEHALDGVHGTIEYPKEFDSV